LPVVVIASHPITSFPVSPDPGRTGGPSPSLSQQGGGLPQELDPDKRHDAPHRGSTGLRHPIVLTPRPRRPFDGHLVAAAASSRTSSHGVVASLSRASHVGSHAAETSAPNIRRG